MAKHCNLNESQLPVTRKDCAIRDTFPKTQRLTFPRKNSARTTQPIPPVVPIPMMIRITSPRNQCVRVTVFEFRTLGHVQHHPAVMSVRDLFRRPDLLDNHVKSDPK